MSHDCHGRSVTRQALIAAAVCGFVACSGGGSSAPAPSSPAAPPVAPPPAAAGGDVLTWHNDATRTGQ
jgi:hypothetical protein